MTNSRLKTDSLVELTRRIAAMPRAEQNKILLDVTTYRSGEDQIGSVYMGGLAHASLQVALGWPNDPARRPYAVLIPGVSDDRIARGIEAVIHTIQYMLNNPREKCPCCGQITPYTPEVELL
jgi:hypothetical protein